MFELRHMITPFVWYDRQASAAAALQRAYDGV
jgi:hypothetical protein